MMRGAYISTVISQTFSPYCNLRMSDPLSIPPRIRGLDSLRFICALLVVFQHIGGVPLLAGVGYDSASGKLSHWIYDIFSCGFAAVIVFFVISGFCIHFPYRDGQPVLKWQFWLRRYIRVLPPLLLAMGLAYWAGANMSLLSVSVTWSVVAELVYYALYPVILWLSKLWGWNRLLAGSVVVSAIVISVHGFFYPQEQLYAVFGPGLNWLVGLPCWLLGCKLAHDWNRQRRAPSFAGIWLWRMAVLAACWISNFLMVHTPIGLPWSLNLFAFAAFFWLREEIAWHQAHRESRVLAWAGTWSYSLYLTHAFTSVLLEKWLPLAESGMWFRWMTTLAIILAFAWLFYLAIEASFHRLARKIPIRPFGLEPYFSRSEMLRLDEKYLELKGWQEGKFADLLRQLFRLYVQAPEHPGKMRLEHWLASRILPAEGVPYRVKAGIRLLLHPKDWIEYILIKTENYQPVTVQFLQRNLRPGDTAFIAGVNFGYHLVVSAGKVGPSGRVIGIEPQPQALCRTMENLRLNGLNGNVVLVAGALGASSRLLPLEEAPVENTGEVRTKNAGEHSRLRICSQPVEEIAANLSCFHPRLFLVDVEGFEDSVLKGFGEQFRPEFLVIKLSRSMPSPGNVEGEFGKRVRDLGYDLHDLKGNPVNGGTALIESYMVAVRRGASAPAWCSGSGLHE